jgi:hypothetical protein
MGDSKRRKKLLGGEYGQTGRWEPLLLRIPGQTFGEQNSLERSIATPEVTGTLSIVGPFRNLKDTKVKKSQIGLQQIASAIVGCELRLSGRAGEQDFSIEGVGFLFAEQPENPLTLKSMWLGDDRTPAPEELVTHLQDPTSALHQSISQEVCAVAVAVGKKIVEL